MGLYMYNMTEHQPFSLLLKPASFDCNLRCKYCFYLEKESYFGNQTHRMSVATLEALTRSFLATPMPQHYFGWQGGEPTLMGLEFFHHAVRLQKKYNQGSTLLNALQTNGVLLNEQWAKFLHKNSFLVGVSIDGPKNIHNRFRKFINDKGSYDAVHEAVTVLKKHQVDFNSLTLVSTANQNSPIEVYEHLKSLGSTYHQYIECIEFKANGERQEFAIGAGKWGEFLCQIFDHWYKYDTSTVSIRLFDSILSRLIYGHPTICSMSGNCCNYLVVEHNGDVFPCDFNVREELILGNVNSSELSTLFNLPKYTCWGELKEPQNSGCFECRYLALCMGDCPKNRFTPSKPSDLCDDWKIFYSHTIERFEALAQKKIKK